MESLGSLARFVDKNPQVVEGILQYAFLGGTAIRLTQEKAQYEEEMRDFSDFDVLVFGDGQYPIHQSSLDNILGSFSVSREDALGCISDVELNGRNYRFMDGNFLTLTKTCVVDCQPREKDYKDVFCLNDLGLLDFDKIRDLYSAIGDISINSGLATDILEWLLKDPSENKSKLFQTFRDFVGLSDNFEDSETVRDILFDYTSRETKSSYEVNSVFNGINRLVGEFADEDSRIRVLRVLLNSAEEMNYIEFDRLVESSLSQRIKYASGQDEKLRVLSDVLENRKV